MSPTQTFPSVGYSDLKYYLLQCTSFPESNIEYKRQYPEEDIAPCLSGNNYTKTGEYIVRIRKNNLAFQQKTYPTVSDLGICLPIDIFLL